MKSLKINSFPVDISIVKIGGNIIDNPSALSSFLQDFAKIRGKKLLVHGGGKEATRLSGELGIETVMIDGRRVTDKASIDLVTMVYAGLINKRIVSLLQAYGCDAIGLSGADGNVIKASRRSPQPVDYGYVGDIAPDDVNVGFIEELMALGKVPVLCAICHDGNGTLLNCNADTIASSVATAFSKVASVNLTYCFEKPGVMYDLDDDSSVIPYIDEVSFMEMKSVGKITKGMIPKIQNALDALDKGVGRIRICNAESLLIDGGTIIGLKQ